MIVRPRHILFHGEENTEESPILELSAKDVVKRLLKLLAPYKFRILLLTILIIVNTLTNLIGPYILKIAVDDYIVKGNIKGLAIIALLYVSINIVSWLVLLGRTYIMGWIGNVFVYKLREKLFNHIQELSMNFFTKSRAGDLISRVINDTSTIQETFLSGALSLIGDILTLAGVIIAMLLMNVKLTLVSLTVIPFIVLIAYLFSGPLRKAYLAVRRKIAQVTTKVQETVAGARVIKAYAREEEAIRSFMEASKETFEANIHAIRISALFIFLTPQIFSLGTVLVLWYGGILVLSGEVTVGVLIAFLSYVSSFFGPIMTLTNFYGSLQGAIAAAGRVFYVLDIEPEIKDAPDAVKLERVRGEIIFENVTFAYEPGQPVLKNINLRILPGERIAIVGPTGAGKTTLVNLICRFYDVTEGRILIDGYDVRKVTQRSLRKQIGFVPQETFLFPGSVRENIRLGKPEATDEEVEEVCKKLGIHDFIIRLPQGYETILGEQGIGLSTGQKQLISIARCMLKNPPILILDEAMYSVDPYTEALIRKALSKLMEGRTTIIIAHRLSMARDADRIIVLYEGRVVEEGTHEELMAKKGLYYKLYTTQMKETIIPSIAKNGNNDALA